MIWEANGIRALLRCGCDVGCAALEYVVGIPAARKSRTSTQHPQSTSSTLSEAPRSQDKRGEHSANFPPQGRAEHPLSTLNSRHQLLSEAPRSCDECSERSAKLQLQGSVEHSFSAPPTRIVSLQQHLCAVATRRMTAAPTSKVLQASKKERPA